MFVSYINTYPIQNIAINEPASEYLAPGLDAKGCTGCTSGSAGGQAAVDNLPGVQGMLAGVSECAQ